MAKPDVVWIRRLVAALRGAAYEVSELGCTCVNSARGHQPGCTGRLQAARYYATATRAETALRRMEERGA